MGNDLALMHFIFSERRQADKPVSLSYSFTFDPSEYAMTSSNFPTVINDRRLSISNEFTDR